MRLPFSRHYDGGENNLWNQRVGFRPFRAIGGIRELDSVHGIANLSY